MQRILAWLLPSLTTLVTGVFFFLMTIRSSALSRPVGAGYLSVAVVAALAAIALNVMAVAVYGVIAARNERDTCNAGEAPIKAGPP